MTENFSRYELTDDQVRIRDHSKDVRALLKQTYWANQREQDVINKSIDNSICIAVFDTECDKMVAFARAVTDYSTMYYLCDVVVDENYRGQGIAKKMVGWFTCEDEQLLGKRGILVTKDAQGLYSKCGFGEYPYKCMTK